MSCCSRYSRCCTTWFGTLMTKMKRPKRKLGPRPRTPAELRELAASATYVGSAEHKDVGWWGGLPRGRQLPGKRVGRRESRNTTICPLISRDDQEKATEWVRNAIQEGKCRFFFGDKRFPKKIWFEAEQTIWTGLCVNSELGQYKGWPSTREQRDAIFG